MIPSYKLYIIIDLFLLLYLHSLSFKSPKVCLFFFNQVGIYLECQEFVAQTNFIDSSWYLSLINKFNRKYVQREGMEEKSSCFINF